MTAKPIITGVRHVGLYAPDPTVLAEFYQAILGLKVIGLSGLNLNGVRHSVFLSGDSKADHHQLAIFANPAHAHIAFEVTSLADLRVLYQQIIDRGLPIRWTVNHGVSLAFYFADPAGNLIKLYWPTGIAYPQPHGHPIDLSRSEATLHENVAGLVASLAETK